MAESRTSTLILYVSAVIFYLRTPTYISQVTAGYKESGFTDTLLAKTISTLKVGGSGGIGAETLDGLK